MTSEAVPSDRYGAPAPWRRRVLIGACVLVVVAFSGWLAWVTLDAATPDVESELIGFDVVDEHTTTADVQVDFGSDDVVATCRVRVSGEDGIVVGELSFTATPAEGTRYRPSVRTERRGDAVEVGCTTPDQNRPR